MSVQEATPEFIPQIEQNMSEAPWGVQRRALIPPESRRQLSKDESLQFFGKLWCLSLSLRRHSFSCWFERHSPLSQAYNGRGSPPIKWGNLRGAATHSDGPSS